jgi:hypothetical protein
MVFYNFVPFYFKYLDVLWPYDFATKIILFFKLVYMNKFNLENCTNVKSNLNSFSLLRLISSEKSKYVVKKH